ncbi:MAG: DUF362 domain-containing protein [Spirochaetales bacterium]|nr:DUF362 domain-containing protein [Spirochaetales bacterium]
MDKSRVALVRCSSYDEQELFEAVKAGVDLLGGVERFAARDEKMLLKPNVLAGDPPERCVCTHPQVVKAVGRLFQGRSRNVSYGDSPGPGHAAAHLESSGISAAARELGLTLGEFDHGRTVEFPQSPFTRSFPIANAVLETDALVSLSKLKTHTLTRMTGAVKNLYGCVTSPAKRRFHLQYPSTFEFSQMLVSLALLLKPRLHIMDGIMAMEGNGPRGGEPRHMGVLLFSTDPVALDAVMADLVELNPLYVSTNRPGFRWGLGTYQKDEIEVVGDAVASARDGDFQVRRGRVLDLSVTGVMTVISNLIAQRPVILEERCVRCGLCVEACPVEPKALNWHDGNRERPPSYKYLRCIRCFCCQEICPEKAITVRKTALKL